jgi:hypothetical protein
MEWDTEWFSSEPGSYWAVAWLWKVQLKLVLELHDVKITKKRKGNKILWGMSL